MNAAPSHAMGNGPVVGSSTSNNSKPHLANGGCNKILLNGASVPNGDIQSLHLPVVVILVIEPVLAWCYFATQIKVSHTMYGYSIILESNWYFFRS